MKPAVIIFLDPLDPLKNFCIKGAVLLSYLEESVLRCRMRPVDDTAMSEWPGIIARVK